MRLLLISLTVVLVLLFSAVANAADQETLTPEKLELIKSNCVSAQVILQQIQYNDAANRINRGQGYENILSSLMIPLNARTAANDLSSSAADLNNITSHYQQLLSDFKKDYDNYDNSLTHTLHVKCQAKPIEFNKDLNEMRKQRVNISNDVTALSQLIGGYRQTVVKLQGGI